VHAKDCEECGVPEKDCICGVTFTGSRKSMPRGAGCGVADHSDRARLTGTSLKGVRSDERTGAALTKESLLGLDDEKLDSRAVTKLADIPEC
jgi:hypothetical protein